MSSEETDEPVQRSPEELAAVLADLAAASEEPPRPTGHPAWRPVGDTPPDIWATPQPGADPLTQLGRDVASVEARTPAPARRADPAPVPTELYVVPDDAESEPVQFRSVPAPAKSLGPHSVSAIEPPRFPTLEPIGDAPSAWSTLDADRLMAGHHPPRTRLLSGVVAAARKFGGHRRHTSAAGPGT